MMHANCSNHSIGIIGATALAEALIHNPTLKLVELENIMLSNNGACFVFLVLKAYHGGHSFDEKQYIDSVKVIKDTSIAYKIRREISYITTSLSKIL